MISSHILYSKRAPKHAKRSWGNLMENSLIPNIVMETKYNILPIGGYLISERWYSMFFENKKKKNEHKNSMKRKSVLCFPFIPTIILYSLSRPRFKERIIIKKINVTQKIILVRLKYA
jgi:hypothetical protein